MRRTTISRAAAIFLTAGAISPVWAAAPVVLEPDAGSTGPSIGSLGAPLIEHKLDIEMTVRNWVLCASQPSAEKLLHARQTGPDAAVLAFADLKASKACGQFAEMQVILQKSVYETLVDSGAQAKIYGALVNISGSWAAAYVVYGGIPNN
jgi:hypothetical protein